MNMAANESENSDIDLYCSSSSISDFECSDSDTELQPYLFEPIRTEDEDVLAESRSLVNVVERVGNTDWCRCGYCEEMTTEQESRCCQEIDDVMQKVLLYNETEDSNICCIAEHPGFQTVCLDPYVLETAYYQYRQQYGQYEGANNNERQRYVGYRQLARWCWGFLGKEVRVILPSCAVNSIRATYPSLEYRGFADA